MVIFLDVDFFASFKTFATRPPSSSSPYTSLITILRHSPSISALRILVAESTGDNSPWTRTALQRPDGIPVANALSVLLSSSSSSKKALKFKLPCLKTLELDALSDIAPLLRLAPNLENLKLNLPNGFAAYTNAQLVEGLKNVPSLKCLSYAAESLRVTPYDEDEGEGEMRGAELLMMIGEVLPCVEVLDLQARWYGDEVMFPLAVEAVSPEVGLFTCRKAASNKTLIRPLRFFL